MRTHSVRTGTLTILLLVTMLVVAVLAVVSLHAAQTDFVRSQNYAQAATVYYENDTAAQELLAQIDAAAKGKTGSGSLDERVASVLPDMLSVEDHSVSFSVVDGQVGLAQDDDESVEFSDSGLADSGLADSGLADSGLADSETSDTQSSDNGTPALLVTVSYSKIGCTVEQWNQVRVNESE